MIAATVGAAVDASWAGAQNAKQAKVMRNVALKVTSELQEYIDNVLAESSPLDKILNKKSHE